MVNKHSKLMGLLLIVLVASALISLGIGRYALSLEQILQILTAKLNFLLIQSISKLFSKFVYRVFYLPFVWGPD